APHQILEPAPGERQGWGAGLGGGFWRSSSCKVLNGVAQVHGMSGTGGTVLRLPRGLALEE
ncbi:UNVERIFIED_CONTAM: hypothetical protein K2H54_056655, partial [Gekko kuhli]